MSALVLLFVESGLVVLGVSGRSAPRTADLASAIELLDLSPANLAVALIFLDKYRRNTVNCLDVDDISAPYYTVLSALVLANKFLNDRSYTLRTWHLVLAKTSTMCSPLALLNQLEAHFLCVVGFGLSTKHDASLWQTLDHILLLAQLRRSVDPAEPSDTLSCATSVLATPPLAPYSFSPHYSLALSPRHWSPQYYSPHLRISPLASPWDVKRRKVAYPLALVYPNP